MEEEKNENINSENNDDTTGNASGSDETEPTLEDFQELKKKAEELEQKNKQLFERAKKAEEAKKISPKETNNEALTRDEVILIAKGISEEELNLAKVIQAGKKAMGDNKSLTEIYNTDPAITALREKKQAEEKAEQANLGASSKGSTSNEETFKPEMPRDEHKKAWEKAMAEL